MKKSMSNISYDKNYDLEDTDDDVADDDTTDDETQYEKDVKALFYHIMEKYHTQIFNRFTQASYFYLFKHYFVIEDNPTPPPEYGYC